ncbi:MAG: PASTA domain-containing protein [Mangrovibacterium sp.]
MITLSAISTYTHHGVSYEVPDLDGVNINKVDPMLEAGKMNLVISDSLFVDDKSPGTILEQMPGAGQQVKEGRKIFVTICASNPEQILMPQLTDISFRQAVSIIQSSGLRIGDINYKASEYEGLVLEQQYQGNTIESGMPIAKGAYIDLTVGKKGDVGKSIIPDLRGISQEDAQAVLDSLHLMLGAVIYDNSIITPEDSLNARIVNQKPMSDSLQESHVDYGSLVDVWLSVDSTKLMKLDKDASKLEYTDETDIEF